MGYLQLTFKRCLLCRRLLQFLHVFDQRLLHLLKRVAQLVYLVAALHLGQLRMEVAFGHLIGRCRQLFDRLDGPLDGPASEDVHHQQSHDNEQNQEATQHIAEDVDEKHWRHETHRPVTILDGLITDKNFLVIQYHFISVTILKRHHFTADTIRVLV